DFTPQVARIDAHTLRREGPSRLCYAGSVLHALRTGFLTNAPNPKTMLFVISAFTQVVQPGSPLALDFAYGAFMSFAHWLWFSLVAVFFSSAVLRKAMIDRQV
ncbi:LysE family transporter, partial [Pseudomonas syringae]|uniref:LysE family translocator n=1 Tax=Pseudomonas syringae TaxID=317 RepID=UPI0034D65849